jgi:hypothetical protein
LVHKCSVSETKRVSHRLSAHLDGASGLFTSPNFAVPVSESDVVFLACQGAFRVHHLRFSATGDHVPLEALDKSIPAVDFGSVKAPDFPSDEDVGAVISTRGTGRDSARPPTGSDARSASRQLLSIVLVIVDIVIFILATADLHGLVRYILGIVLGLVIPGWSAVGLLKLENAALEMSLVLASSLTFVMIAAQIMITLHQWHPVAFEEILCVVCLPPLLYQSRLVRAVLGRRQ